jgi:hypothetical protein
VCCQSGILDECQLCDGDGLTCAVLVQVSLGAPDDVTGIDQTDSTQYQAFVETFTRQISILMNVLPSQIKVMARACGACTVTPFVHQCEKTTCK